MKLEGKKKLAQIFYLILLSVHLLYWESTEHGLSIQGDVWAQLLYVYSLPWQVHLFPQEECNVSSM